MMRAHSSGWLLLSLLAFSVLLAAELHFGIGTGSRAQTEEQPSMAPESYPVASFTLPERESFSDTLTRPLFIPNRQPLGATPVAPAAPMSHAAPPNTARYALSAIIIVDNERIALLTDSATGDLIRLREGEGVAGWQLEEIRENSAVLRDGDNREELSLRTFGPPAPRPRPPDGRAAPGTRATAEAGDNDSGPSPEPSLNAKRARRQRLKLPGSQSN